MDDCVDEVDAAHRWLAEVRIGFICPWWGLTVGLVNPMLLVRLNSQISCYRCAGADVCVCVCMHVYVGLHVFVSKCMNACALW